MSVAAEPAPAFDTDVVGRRVLAQIVDYGCTLGLVVLLVGTSASVWAFGFDGVPPRAVFTPIPLLVGFSYNVGTEEYWNGQTLGKRLLGIRVRPAREEYLSFQQIVLRNLPALLWANGLIYVVGLLAVAVHDREQRLFDQLADTVVVDAD